MVAHLVKIFVIAGLAVLGYLMEPAAGAQPKAEGLVTLRSGHSVADTADRLEAELRAKGIVIFARIDQAALAAERGIALPPSVLLVFGNVTIGSRFIAANPLAGLDWPVRVLVSRDAAGEV